MVDKYEEGDIVEPDEWQNPEEQVFNHQVLIMNAIKKCLELGSKEMREGWWDEHIDKNGNVRRRYNSDTRKDFMESVKSLMMVAACDYDEDATKNINAALAQIDVRRKYWMDEEWKWWLSLTPMQKGQLVREGKQVSQGFFNSKLPFDNFFFEDELNLYRTICTEINHLSKRLDFYGTMGYSA